MSQARSLDDATLALRRRIERGEARGYWEENLVAGRQSVTRRLLARMAPLERRRVLHLDPGEGDLPGRVAAAGATSLVLQGDWVLQGYWALQGDWPRSTTDPQPGSAQAVLGTVPLPIAPQSIDDIVLFEHLALIDEKARGVLLSELAHLTAARLFLVLREESRWDRLAAARLPTSDFTSLLRDLHLATGYRLVHREHDRRRNSVLVLAELHHLAPRS